LHLTCSSNHISAIYSTGVTNHKDDTRLKFLTMKGAQLKSSMRILCLILPPRARCPPFQRRLEISPVEIVTRSSNFTPAILHLQLPANSTDRSHRHSYSSSYLGPRSYLQAILFTIYRIHHACLLNAEYFWCNAHNEGGAHFVRDIKAGDEFMLNCIFKMF
jgi:hypothetical protein